jgi:hypothetical protein
MTVEHTRDWPPVDTPQGVKSESSARAVLRRMWSATDERERSGSRRGLRPELTGVPVRRVRCSNATVRACPGGAMIGSQRRRHAIPLLCVRWPPRRGGQRTERRIFLACVLAVNHRPAEASSAVAFQFPYECPTPPDSGRRARREAVAEFVRILDLTCCDASTSHEVGR